jgi:magnesium-transporting ATPase (P-type)
LSDFTLRVLIVAAILSIILEESVATGDAQQTGWIEGVSILLAVMICATVTAVNNYQKEKQFQKLNHIS